MRTVNIERIIVNPEENQKITNIIELLDNMSICGDNEITEFAVEIAENLAKLQNKLLVLEDDDNNCFVQFSNEEITYIDCFLDYEPCENCESGDCE